MKTSRNIFIVTLLIGLYASNAQAQSASVTVNQDSKIPALLEMKKELEKDNKLSDGFTVQLYYGELSKANEIIRSYKGKFGNWPATIEYETPNYKVWAGNFSTRIDAERALMKIQQNFPSAFILKPDRRK